MNCQYCRKPVPGAQWIEHSGTCQQKKYYQKAAAKKMTLKVKLDIADVVAEAPERPVDDIQKQEAPKKSKKAKGK